MYVGGLCGNFRCNLGFIEAKGSDVENVKNGFEQFSPF